MAGSSTALVPLAMIEVGPIVDCLRVDSCKCDAVGRSPERLVLVVRGQVAGTVSALGAMPMLPIRTT